MKKIYLMLLSLAVAKSTDAQTVSFDANAIPVGGYITRANSVLKIPFSVDPGGSSANSFNAVFTVTAGTAMLSRDFIIPENEFNVSKTNPHDTLIVQTRDLPALALGASATITISAAIPGGGAAAATTITLIKGRVPARSPIVPYNDNSYGIGLSTYMNTLSTMLYADPNQLVMPRTFSLISQDLFSRLAPDITGDEKIGSGLSVKFDDKDAKINGQVAIKTAGKSYVIAGANTSVAGATEFFNGKKGVRPGWGFKLGFSVPVYTKLYFNESHREVFLEQRSFYLDSIYSAYEKAGVFNRSKTDDLFQYYKNEYNNILASNLTLSDIEYSQIREELKKWSKTKAAANALYGNGDSDGGKDSNGDGDPANDIGDIAKRKLHMAEYIKEKTTEYEKANAKWTGHLIVYLTGSMYYNSKSFTSYTETQPTVSQRFEKVQFNNWGGNLSANLVWQTRRFYQAASLSMGYGSRATYDLSDNQKFYNTYQTETIVPDGDSSALIYVRNEQKAYNKDSIKFETFGAFTLDGQYTVLFGNRKNFGLNIAGSYAYARMFSPNARVDFQGGPMFVIPGKDDEVSKTNFGFYAAYRNILGTGLARDKFSVGIFLRVPVNLLKY